MGITLHAVVPLLLLATVPGNTAQRCDAAISRPSAPDEQALAEFGRAVDEYVTLHRRIERTFPPERLFDDADEMLDAQAALRGAILRVRAHAQQGDVFTAGPAAALRGRLLRAIRCHGHDPADIIADNRAERLPGVPLPVVNKRFPWGLGAGIWPTLLRALPELPAELEYRIVDRDLVLIDIHANLVVDILRAAIPAAASEDEDR